MTKAIQKPQQTVADIFKSELFQERVSQSLPKHLTAERFLSIARNSTFRTPALKNCDPLSFSNALVTLSQLGLEPDGRLAHLIPFRNGKTGSTECQLIIDYKGLVQLARRSGQVSKIHAAVVCENDLFEYDKGEVIKHKVDFKNPRGAIYAVYAMVQFKDGTEQYEVMTKDEVEAVRKRSRAGTSGPWVTDWAEMAKKTCFRRLSKWIDLSPEYRDALDHDADAMEEQRFANAKPVVPVTLQQIPPAAAGEEVHSPSEPLTSDSDGSSTGPQETAGGGPSTSADEIMLPPGLQKKVDALAEQLANDTVEESAFVAALKEIGLATEECEALKQVAFYSSKKFDSIVNEYENIVAQLKL